MESSAELVRRKERYEAATKAAMKKAKAFEEALKSGDQKKIMKALVAVQSDWEAIKAINKHSDDVKLAFNKNLQNMYNGVDEKVKAQGGQVYEFPPSEMDKIRGLIGPIYNEWVAKMEARGVPGRAILDEAASFRKQQK